MNQTIPFTVDHVGSFLRPKSIKEARQRVKEQLPKKNFVKSKMKK